MPATPPLPLVLRARVLRKDVRQAIRKRQPKRLLRAAGSFVAPQRWPPPAVLRNAVIDHRLAAGDPVAARVALRDLAGQAEAQRPGRPAALRRAAAIELAVPLLPPPERQVERTVAAYLRGELGAPPAPPPPDPARLAAMAAAAADRLRGEGHARPLVVATYPGFHANPYSRLMERAYPSQGLAAIHVDRVEDVDVLVEGAAAGGYRAVVHVNAPDRFVKGGRRRTDPPGSASAAAAIDRLDGWLARGAAIVSTIHNGPRMVGERGEAERAVAQAVADRAVMVHVLAARTPQLLAGWVTLDPARLVHVPHPNYDGAYGPLPTPAEARALLGLDAGTAAPTDVITIGLLGSLADRKGGILLLDALARVPDPLPDGRRIRLLVAGVLSGGRSEELIRRAAGDPRVVTRFGFIPDEALPALLAALDIAVVPYSQYLNSGWLHLALTAGIPAIAPEAGSATEVVAPDALLTFIANDPVSLGATLARAGELATPRARRAARASVARLAPDLLSARFAGALREAVDASVPARPQPEG